MSGTGRIVYNLLPVISEVARDSGIPAERPLSIPYRGAAGVTASLYLPPWRR